MQTAIAQRAPWQVALGVFLVAWVLRASIALALPTLYHPDEIYQALENAHRMVFGYGYVTWEAEYGIRSSVFPGFLAGIIQASRLLGEGPHVYLPAVTVVLAALAAGAVTCAYLWASRLYGVGGGLVAAFVPLAAPELVLLGSKTLTEVAGTHLLIIGLYLAFPGFASESRSRALAAGLLLGAAMVIRLHMAPGLAVIGIAMLRSWPFERVALATLGGLASVLILGGLVDWFTWGAPFFTHIQNVRLNILYGVAASFGVWGWYFYLGLLLLSWGTPTLIILGFAGLGSRRAPLLLLVAGAILVAHQIVGHKEYRFIYPTLFLAQILAGFGLMEVINWLRLRGVLDRLFQGLPSPRVLVAIWMVVLFTAGLRIATFSIEPLAGLAVLHRRDTLQASRAIATLPNVCGIASYPLSPHMYGGYSSFHRRVPYYPIKSLAEWQQRLPAFNTAIVTKEFAAEQGLPIVACYLDRTCLVQRPGTCEAQPVGPIDRPGPLTNVPRLRELWPPPEWR
ncbi:MAG: Alg9 family protein mannosyltransferase [Xanthobacteraceae bacterium]|nr:MAG: Alg9 family protein mannosyltransferase [Xanthobacteraceae bacterium]